ncbi:MAG: DinB family protein [Candidatus Thorarchaeota archaeon]
MKDNIINGLHRQFTSSCKMLRNAIESVPEEKWHEGSEGWFFSLTAYHAVETMDFYLRNTPEGMKWGGRAGYDWDKSKDTRTDILPKITKEIVMAYLEETEDKLNDIFNSWDTKKLNAKDDFKWFPSVFERMTYLLRHNMHHIGELSKTLRDWKCERVKWT